MKNSKKKIDVQEKAKILFDKVVDYVDDFMVYRIARTAFRNGHWKLVAAPLLESINEKVCLSTTKLKTNDNPCHLATCLKKSNTTFQTESRETKNWLVALTNIAHSQVTKVEAEDFAAGHNFLNQAFLLLGVIFFIFKKLFYNLIWIFRNLKAWIQPLRISTSTTDMCNVYKRLFMQRRKFWKC